LERSAKQITSLRPFGVQTMGDVKVKTEPINDATAGPIGSHNTTSGRQTSLNIPIKEENDDDESGHSDSSECLHCPEKKRETKKEPEGEGSSSEKPSNHCSSCNSIFESEQMLLLHIGECHPHEPIRKPRNRQVCSQCRAFVTGLAGHMAVIHKKKGRRRILQDSKIRRRDQRKKELTRMGLVAVS